MLKTSKLQNILPLIRTIENSNFETFNAFLCIFFNGKWRFVGKNQKIEPYPTRVA